MIRIEQGDITKLAVDAIVNAANQVMLGGGGADAYDTRGVMLSRQRCDRLVGYGPEGYVVMRGNCYWIHKANGCNAMPPMIPYNFEKKKWDMHDSYLRIMC